MNSKSKIIARFGIIAALITSGIVIDSLISAFTPVTVAVATLVITLTICQVYDLKTAVFASTVFGILSFIRAYTIPFFLSPVMQNPLVSVLPRICIGFTCYSSLVVFKRIFTKKDLRINLPHAFSAAIGVITNTGLVFLMMSMFALSTLKNAFTTMLAINFSIEFVCSILIVPTLSRATMRIRRNSDIKKEPVKEEETGEDKVTNEEEIN